MPIPTDTADALTAVRDRLPADAPAPEIALILGSGLGALADAVENATAIPTADVPGYPRSTVAGHSGRLVFGTLEGRHVLVVQGRAHLYEGHSPRATAFPVRLAHALGAERLLVTNAAGGIRSDLGPGSLMFIEDIINHAFHNPLTGPNDDGGPRFPDMSAPFDAAWLDAAEQVALDERVCTKRGVYLWTAGPSYETPAEIRMFARLGADAVGMSTVPEVIQARYFGMRTLGISAITNHAAGLHHEALDHADVLDVSAHIRADFERLIRGILRETL